MSRLVCGYRRQFAVLMDLNGPVHIHISVTAQTPETHPTASNQLSPSQIIVVKSVSVHHL